jgi:hypothetical protein
MSGHKFGIFRRVKCVPGCDIRHRKKYKMTSGREIFCNIEDPMATRTDTSSVYDKRSHDYLPTSKYKPDIHYPLSKT